MDILPYNWFFDTRPRSYYTYPRYAQSYALSDLFNTVLDVEPVWTPKVKYTDEKDHYLINAEFPDFKPEDLKITLEDNMVKISGEKRKEEEAKDGEEKAVRKQSYYGSFCRQYKLPKDSDVERISAQSENGVLKVEIPKRAEKTIEIEVRKIEGKKTEQLEGEKAQE